MKRKIYYLLRRHGSFLAVALELLSSIVIEYKHWLFIIVTCKRASYGLLILCEGTAHMAVVTSRTVTFLAGGSWRAAASSLYTRQRNVVEPLCQA